MKKRLLDETGKPTKLQAGDVVFQGKDGMEIHRGGLHGPRITIEGGKTLNVGCMHDGTLLALLLLNTDLDYDQKFESGEHHSFDYYTLKKE